MDNQHRKISGYRELTQEEIDLINKIKHTGQGVLSELIKQLEKSGADPRWLAIGKTHMQEGLMALTRSVAKPDFF